MLPALLQAADSVPTLTRHATDLTGTLTPAQLEQLEAKPLAVLRGMDAAGRARQVFAQLRVWDTEHNSGVLFYALLAERRIEIIADRGIAARVDAGAWDAICIEMRENYARGQWREGSLAGIARAHALLDQHFPADGLPNPDELPDRPVVL